MTDTAISVAPDINAIQMVEQGSTPSTPASGYWRAYVRGDGLYLVDDTGAVYGPVLNANLDVLPSVDGTLDLGSPSLAWAKGYIDQGILPQVIGGEGSGDDLILDSTSHATKGYLELNGALARVDDAGDFYGRSDTEQGLIKTLIQLGTTPDTHFLSSYSPLTTFAGAPFETGNYDFTQPSVLRMYGTAVNKRQFLYDTVNITTGGNNKANCVVSAGVNVSFAGLRVDDGSDNNYLEWGMRTTGLSYGALSFYTRKRTGGGAVTETQVGLANMNATIPYAIRIWSLAGTNFCYIKGLAPGWIFMAGESYGYTITRRGLVVTANSSDTPNSDFAGNFNSFEED